MGVGGPGFMLSNVWSYFSCPLCASLAEPPLYLVCVKSVYVRCVSVCVSVCLPFCLSAHMVYVLLSVHLCALCFVACVPVCVRECVRVLALGRSNSTHTDDGDH